MRRRWFPKVTVTVLAPVKLAVDPELKGRHRRQAAGAALYEIMSDLVFRTTSTDRTVFAGGGRGRRACMAGAASRSRIRSTGSLTYKRLLLGARVLGRKLMPLAAEGEALGVMLPNANGAAVTHPRPDVGRARAGDDQLHRRRRQHPRRLQGRRGEHHRHLARLRREGQARRPRRRSSRRRSAIVYLEDVRATRRRLRQAARRCSRAGAPLVARKPDDPAVILFTSGSEGTPKGVVLSHRNMLANAAQAAARIDFGRTDKVFNVLPVFHSFGLTVGIVLPLVSGVPVYLYPSPLHYRHRAGAGLRHQRHDPVRHRHLPRRLCAHRASLRFPLAALHPRRRRAGEGVDAPQSTWRSSACASSKAMA